MTPLPSQGPGGDTPGKTGWSPISWSQLHHEPTLECPGADPTFLLSLLSPSPLTAQGRWDLGLLLTAVYLLSSTPMPSPSVCLLGYKNPQCNLRSGKASTRFWHLMTPGPPQLPPLCSSVNFLNSEQVREATGNCAAISTFPVCREIVDSPKLVFCQKVTGETLPPPKLGECHAHLHPRWQGNKQRQNLIPCPAFPPQRK